MSSKLSISPAEDDDDWTELTPAKAAAIIKANATVRLSANESCTKNSASIALRHELAAWAEKHGPNFRIQIGGSNANKLRILADKAGGYKATNFRGTYRLLVKNISAWPFESREMPVEAKVTVSKDTLTLTLPDDFAKPIGSRPKPLRPAPAKPTTPPTTAAPEVRRVVGMGEPAPGRSALDQRRAEAGRGK